jgi:hypothetical protein
MSIARIVLSILMTLSVIAGVALAGDTQTVSVNVDSSLIRPPEFPTLDDAAKITEPRVVRRFPEVGFQIGGGIGFFNNDKLNDSFGRAESEYGIWQKRGFGTTQLSPEIGVRLFFTPQLMALFQWTYGGDPGGGSFRYSLVSSNLLFAPISSKSAFLFFGAGVGHYELKAKRNYSQSVEGNGTLTDMSLSDVGATAIPLLALFEYRPLESPNYSLFLSARYIPTKSIAFNMPLWGKSNTEVGITADLGGFWISAGFSYGI